MRWGNFTTVPAILINAAAWAAIQVSIGLAMARLPLDKFNPNSWIFKIRPWETRHLYERRLRVKKWKWLLPDGARLSRNGFRKRTLVSSDAEYLEGFARETLRAESTHWLAIPPFVLFFVWNIPSVAGWMPVYAILANAPCIAVQRYNRMRINRILETIALREQGISSALRSARYRV